MRDRFWTLVRTKPRRERWAAENVENQGHQVILPFTLNERLRPTPMFRSYLFVEVTGAWYHLKNTFGVSNIVMNDEGLSVVPEKVIDAISGSMDWNGLIGEEYFEFARRETAPRKFKENQPVRVNSGTFSGLVGKFLGMKDEGQRVQLLFNIIGRSVPVTLDRVDVEAA